MRKVLYALLLVLLAPAALLAAPSPINLATSGWKNYAGTGTLSNLTEDVPGVGTNVTILRATTAQGVGYGFLQDASSRIPGLNARYARLTFRSTSSFFVYIMVRATDNQLYYVTYYDNSWKAFGSNPAYAQAPRDFSSGTAGLWKTINVDLLNDLRANFPGLGIQQVLWAAFRGQVDLGELVFYPAADFPFVLSADTDTDLLVNSDEISGPFFSNTLRRDSDGDGVNDGIEATPYCGGALNKLVPGAGVDADGDADGVPTRTEMYFRTDCQTLGSSFPMPVTYGWRAYNNPGDGTVTSSAGALVLSHSDPNPIKLAVLNPDNTGPMPLPNWLAVAKDAARFSIKSAENFYLYFRVLGSDSRQYWVTYLPITAPNYRAGAMTNDDYAVIHLGNYGYLFDGSTFTTVARNLSEDLKSQVPGVTVQKVLYVAARGRMSIKDLAFVAENTLPQITSLSLSQALAKAGDTISITFDVDKLLPANPVVTVHGEAANFVSLVGNTFTYEYVVAGTESEGAGVVKVIADDFVGYRAIATTPITLDFTPPSFSYFDSGPSPAKSGDALLIGFVTSEVLQGNPGVTVAGNAALFAGTSGFTHTFNYFVMGTEPEGSVDVDVSATDLAGNVGTATFSTELDFTKPTFSNLTPAFPAGGAGMSVYFEVDESEPLGAVPTATVGGNLATWIGYNAGVHTFEYWVLGSEIEGPLDIVIDAQDVPGNLNSVSVGSLFADFTPPSISAEAVNPMMAGVGDTVTITFTASELLTTAPQVTVDGLAATQTSQVGNDYTYTYTLTGAEGEGMVPVIIRIRDAAGNLAVAGVPLMVDAPPLVIASSPAMGAAGVTITTSIQVQFNEPMDGLTIDGTTFLVTGGAAVGTVSYNAGTKVASFTLSGGNLLDMDTVYTVTLTTGITDAGGTPLAANHNFTFRTIAAGMRSISGTLDVPASWTNTKVIEATGGHMGTIAGTTYQINVDARDNNLVYAWNDVNDDGTHQPGLEERLFAYNCIWPSTQFFNTLSSNQSGVSITHRMLSGNIAVPPAWNEQVFESVTGNRATISPEGRWTLAVDGGEERHVYVFNDGNLDGLWQPAETRIAHIYDPVGSCFAIMFPDMTFSIRTISGRVTEPSLPILLDMVASGTNPNGPFNYAPIVGPNRNYSIDVFAGWSSIYVFAFDDANANGLMDSGETRIGVSTNPVPVLQGEVTKAYIFRRQISGTVPVAPAGWLRPRVTDGPFGNVVSVPLGGGTYSIYVPLSNQNQLFWFDDVNNNLRLDSAEAAIRYHSTLNTVAGDLTNINFATPCNISGTFTAPSDWAQTFAYASFATYGTVVTAAFSGSNYSLSVPRASAVELVAFEDTDQNGRYDSGSDRHLGYGGYVNNSANCALTANFSTVRMISGNAFPPLAWSTPKVYVSGFVMPVGSGMNVAPVSMNTYQVRTVATGINSLVLFNDINSNDILDDGEPRWYYPGQVDTSGGDAFANFDYRTISGVAAIPLGAVSPKVSNYSISTVVDASGNFTLEVNPDIHYLVFWDDLNGNDVPDWGIEPTFGSGSADTTLGNAFLNFNVFTVQGRVEKPANWTNVMVDVDSGTQSFPVNAQFKYTAFVAPGWHSFKMFEDSNGNGKYDWGTDPSVSLSGALEVTANMTGVNFNFPTVSGSVNVPPTFNNPKIGTWAGPDVAKPVVPAGGAYSMPAYYGNAQVVLFDDLNGDGRFQMTEPAIRRTAFLNITGDMSGIDLYYRTIRGSVAFPPTWARPGVYATGMGGAINGIITGNSYEVYVEPSAWIQVGTYDDRDLNFQFGWPDPNFVRNGFVDTSLGDVNNIDLSYRSISGTLIGTPNAGMINPTIEVVGLGTYTERLTGPTFTVYVPEQGATWNVNLYDDISLNWQKDAFEFGYRHRALACPSTVDTNFGNVTNANIDTSCPY